LRVEVKHGGTQAVLFCSYGQVNRDGRLAGSTFLADDSDCFHGCVFAPKYVVLFVSIQKNVQTCKLRAGPGLRSHTMPASHLAGTGNDSWRHAVSSVGYNAQKSRPS
jgi:hypothetical protein